MSLNPRARTQRGLRSRPKLACLYDCFSEFFLSTLSNTSALFFLTVVELPRLPTARSEAGPSKFQFQIPRGGTMTDPVWPGGPAWTNQLWLVGQDDVIVIWLSQESEEWRESFQKKQKLRKQLLKCVKQVLRCWPPTELMYFNSPFLAVELLLHILNTMA